MKVADRRDQTRNLSLRKRCTNHCNTGPHTKFNTRGRVRTTNPQSDIVKLSTAPRGTRRSVCIHIACNYFFNRKFANQRPIVQQENQIHWARCVKERGLMRSSPTVLQSSLSFLSRFFFPVFSVISSKLLICFVAGSHFSASLSAFTFLQLLQKQLQATRIQTGFFWYCRMRYTCLVSALFSHAKLAFCYKIIRNSVRLAIFGKLCMQKQNTNCSLYSHHRDQI